MEENMEYVDLVLDSGELIRIEYPDKFVDDLYESLGNCLKRNGWWSPIRFDGCRAEYMGMYLDSVNMAKVVGLL